MTHFLQDDAYNALLDRLQGAFMAAATNSGTDLRDQLVEALADADVMPASCALDQLPKVESPAFDPFDLSAFEQHMFAKAMPNMTARSSGHSAPTKPRTFDLTDEGLIERE